MTSISTNLEELTWIPRPRLLALRRLGIETTEDLLTHFPRRHEDRTEFPQFPREETDYSICLCGEVIKTSVRRFGGWKKIFEATLEESRPNALSEPLVCRWFNLHYVQKIIATGQRLVVFGKPRMRGKRICMDHPEFEVIENDEEISIHFRRITPVYPATEGLSQRVLRGMIYRVLHEFPDSGWHAILPNTLAGGERSDAIRAIHFPGSWEARDAAREHLVLSEFFAMQMLITSRRFDSSARAGQAHCGSGALLDRFLKGLPFELTAAQGKVISEIRRDLAANYPMNRLLQGDVGSGKTVVAIAAMLLAVEAGYQAAFMAPTQILAEQHYEVLRRWLELLGIHIALRTAARQEEIGPLPLFAANENPGSARLQRAGDGIPPSRTFIETESTSGAHYSRRRLPQNAGTSTLQACAPETLPLPDGPHIIVGTHALLYENVSFSNLGLAVIDEQHKFGVAQRARLTAREPAPDVLVMTATPIPRTLTMTIYGDLDVSTIDEMPRNRGNIVTAVRDTSKLGEVLSFLRTQLEKGRQLYVIYPLIDESDKLDVKAAAAEYELWCERLRPFRCELLHGRIPAPEKQQIMDRFRRGDTNALISTTVLEVGVDVPNAAIMLIENAERFGLAQLHQLRGRIGRGEHKSYCILLSSNQTKETSAKLTVLERTTNGFEVAEADWELRGPGDVLGTAQSGLPALKIGDLKRDAELMRRARAVAMSIFEMDPRLEQPENQHFRCLIVEQHGQSFSHIS
jgi:ATP-dependent DNA helicase RecG